MRPLPDMLTSFLSASPTRVQTFTCAAHSPAQLHGSAGGLHKGVDTRRQWSLGAILEPRHHAITEQKTFCNEASAKKTKNYWVERLVMVTAASPGLFLHSGLFVLHSESRHLWFPLTPHAFSWPLFGIIYTCCILSWNVLATLST